MITYGIIKLIRNIDNPVVEGIIMDTAPYLIAGFTGGALLMWLT